MISQESNCPLCGKASVKETTIESAVPRKTGIVENRTDCPDGYLYECSGCGSFVIARRDRADYLENERQRNEFSPVRLSALLREHTVLGRAPYWLQFGGATYSPLKRDDLVPIDVNELLARWPRTVPERIERTLCNLAVLSPTGGHCVEFSRDDTALLFAETPREAAYNVKCLAERGYVKDSGGRLKAAVVLSSAGWECFEKLSRGASAPENPVFVAMWFGGQDEKPKMDEAYQQGILPAIEQAGYRAARVDLVEHNDWIMDQVLGNIRLAPFVVADFTGDSKGVYFEAGFARGLGITVIHTCQEDKLGEAHFDTRQLNHVLWRRPEELRRNLYHRIRNTVGQGPYPPPRVAE